MSDDDNKSNSPKVYHQDEINTDDLDPAQSDKNEGDDVELSHPTDDVSELKKTSHLQEELREANIDREYDEDEIDEIFTDAVINVAYNALAAHGVDLTSETLPVDNNYIRALLLAKARGQYLSKFSIYLKNNPDIRDQLNLSSGYSHLTFYRIRNELKDNNINLESIEDASIEALFAVYRRGKPVPDDVQKRHEDSHADTPDITPYSSSYDWDDDEVTISQELRSEAIENWASIFFEECLDPIHLGRSDQTTHEMDAILGLFAHACAQSTTLRDASKTAKYWDADAGIVPVSDTITKPIKALSLKSIMEMFIEANINTIKLAKKHNLMDRSTKVAFDPTDQLYFGSDPDVDKWIKGHAEPLKGDVSSSDASKWEFGLLSTIGSTRFSLGVYPIGDSVSQSDSLETMLREIYDNYDILTDYITMDKGVSGEAMLETIRNSSDLNVIMPANTRNNESIKQQRADLPNEEDYFEDNPDIFTDTKNKPNIYFHPISEEEIASASHRVFIINYEEQSIDRTRTSDDSENESGGDSDEGESLVDLNDEYQNRARIEKTLEQIKQSFMADTESKSTKIRFFYFNIAMAFHNLHTLVNNGISPERRLRLATDENDTVSANEVMTGFKEMAFRRVK